MTNSNSSIVRNPLFAEFDSIFNQLASQYQTPVLRSNSLYVRPIKSEDHIAIAEIEIPGVNPRNVKVHIEGRSLTVETPKGNAYVTIGQRLDSDNATANIKHGLLTIRIPKRDAKIVEVVVSED